MTDRTPVAFAETVPFPHCAWDGFLPEVEANAILEWFETSAPWRLRVESFYEQHEFSLLSEPPPVALMKLVDPPFVGHVEALIKSALVVDKPLAVVNVSAHRLTVGQTIRVHNDYIGTEETHRVLIQLNRGWSIENGGVLMLFGSDSADDVRSVFLPVHASAFAFEISPKSFHAVSTIQNGERYTLVYTFRVNAD
jgi:hypothetical protein